MKTDEKVLAELLKYRNDKYISGESLAKNLDMSRNSVWKAIEKLKKQGYMINGVHGKGYMLLSDSDILSQSLISEKTGLDIELFQELPSTNDHIKQQTYSDYPKVVIADHQSKGKGRLGRRFYSPKGSGLYMSYGFSPDFTAEDTMLITCAVANIIHDAILNVTGKDTKLKWVNDIFSDGKKVCGILTEGEFNLETGLFERVIIGIGINCYKNEVPEDLKDIVGFLSEDKNPNFSRNDLASEIINELNELFNNRSSLNREAIIKEYKKNCFMIGLTIKLNTFSNIPLSVKVLDIGDRGELVIKYLEGEKAGKTEKIISGEIIL